MKMEEKNDYKKYKLNTLNPFLIPPSKKINFPQFYFPILIPHQKKYDNYSIFIINLLKLPNLFLLNPVRKINKKSSYRGLTLKFREYE